MQQIECTLVGDDFVGKSCLLDSLTGDYFSNASDFKMIFEGKSIKLDLWNASFHSDFKALRYFKYRSSDVILLCFSLVSPISLENLESYWIPEIREHFSHAPFILVGLKSDLRDDFSSHYDELIEPGMSLISTERAKEFAKKIGAVEYIECSGLKMKNVTETFELAIYTALHSPKAEVEETLISCGSCLII